MTPFDKFKETAFDIGEFEIVPTDEQQKGSG